MILQVVNVIIILPSLSNKILTKDQFLFASLLFVFYLQLFHIQQLITVFNIMRIFKILPYPEEDLVAWEKAMEYCMGKYFFVNCELKHGD